MTGTPEHLGCLLATAWPRPTPVNAFPAITRSVAEPAQWSRGLDGADGCRHASAGQGNEGAFLFSHRLDAVLRRTIQHIHMLSIAAGDRWQSAKAGRSQGNIAGCTHCPKG